MRIGIHLWGGTTPVTKYAFWYGTLKVWNIKDDPGKVCFFRIYFSRSSIKDSLNSEKQLNVNSYCYSEGYRLGYSYPFNKIECGEEIIMY